MMQSMMKWMRGYLQCCVDSGDWERFMNLCRHHHIRLWNVKTQPPHIDFQMQSGDYEELCAFVGKTHIIPHIVKKRGLPFVWAQAMKNWTFTIGIVWFFLVLRILSLFVWQIHYEGQEEYTKETIRKEVSAMGVYVGMLRKNLNCDSIERSLRETFENISWVSAEEKGCVLNIKIKEGNSEEEMDNGEEKKQHLTAPCDGTVQSIVTAAGTPQVKKGAAVKKGDLLISGLVEITGDDDTIVKKNVVRAEGTVSLLTQISYEDCINRNYVEKNKTGKVINVYTFYWNDKCFSVKNPLKWFDNSDSYDIINYVCLKKNIIPMDITLQIKKSRYICYEKKTKEYTKQEAENLLQSRFESKKEEYEENGYQIQEENLEITAKQDKYYASGTLTALVSKMDRVDITETELQTENQP